MRNSNTFYVEVQNYKCFNSEHYAVLFGPFDMRFRLEIEQEIKGNTTSAQKVVSYAAE